MNERNERWQTLVRKLEALLRLRTFPVAFKLLEDPGDLSANRWLRRPEHKTTLCQMITTVRTYDWTVGAVESDFVLPMCASIIGLSEAVPKYISDGTFRSLVWCRTREDGKRCEDSIPRIPCGKFKAVMMAPLVYGSFEPDMALIYASPAQMILIINALQFDDYERMQFHCVGESSCSDAIAQCYLTGKPSLTIPCYGERRYSGVQDDEMVIALPPALVEKVEHNLEDLYGRGVCYPIAPYGVQADPLPGMPAAYSLASGGQCPQSLGMPPRRITRW